jgi:hypothetical protein
MDNFNKSANQLWKESNTTLSFKDWIEREKEKGEIIPNKKFKGIDGIEVDALDTSKFEDALGLNKVNQPTLDKNKVFGLNKWLLLSSLVVIGGALAYKFYNKNK